MVANFGNPEDRDSDRRLRPLVARAVTRRVEASETILGSESKVQKVELNASKDRQYGEMYVKGLLSKDAITKLVDRRSDLRLPVGLKKSESVFHVHGDGYNSYFSHCAGLELMNMQEAVIST